jgi:hypothetical protein
LLLLPPLIFCSFYSVDGIGEKGIGEEPNHTTSLGLYKSFIALWFEDRNFRLTAFSILLLGLEF